MVLFAEDADDGQSHNFSLISSLVRTNLLAGTVALKRCGVVDCYLDCTALCDMLSLL